MASAPRRRWLNLHALPSELEVRSLFSIRFGRLTKAVMIAITKAQVANRTYGMRTERANSAAEAPAAMKINAAPTLGAVVVAIELKPPARLSRDDAVSGEPSAPT